MSIKDRYVYAILFNNQRIEKNVWDGYRFLANLQTAQTPPKILSWEFFENFQGSYSCKIEMIVDYMKTCLMVKR